MHHSCTESPAQLMSLPLAYWFIATLFVSNINWLIKSIRNLIYVSYRHESKSPKKHKSDKHGRSPEKKRKDDRGDRKRDRSDSHHKSPHKSPKKHKSRHWALSIAWSNLTLNYCKRLYFSKQWSWVLNENQCLIISNLAEKHVNWCKLLCTIPWSMRQRLPILVI